MFIDDKEFQVQKRSNINGVICTLSYHPTLKVSFVCKDDKVLYIGNSGLAPYEYDNLISSCLAQVYQENIVEGSLAC